MLPSRPLVAVTVVAGHLRHHQLWIGALHVGEKLRRRRASELGRNDSVVPNRDVPVLIGNKLETLRCWHSLSL